ncbi:MAG: NAD(P)H-binding protein [Pseudomonadota bacterium]
MAEPTVAIIGGTGFIGSEIAAALTDRGYSLRLVTRRSGARKIRSRLPDLDLIETTVHDPGALSAALAGADAVIVMAGILHESSTGEFDRVHRDLPASIANACVANGIQRLIHIGSLGAGADAPSAYLRSKAAGEVALGTRLSMAQAYVMQLLPVKLLTVDNVRSMQVDNVCSEDHLAALGIDATPLEDIAPAYLSRSR